MSWGIDVSYKLNDVVTYEGSTYKCILEHKSHEAWKPSIFTHAIWQPSGSDTPVVVTPVITTPVPVLTPPYTPIPVSNQTPVISGRSLKTLLNGNRPLGSYYESWSMQWTSSTNNHLTNVKHANIIYISFVSPNCTYKRGQNTWAGTGLSFSSDFKVIKDSIAVLQARGVVVMLSVGGATYPFDANYNADGAANLVKDLGLQGIDIDWENHDQKAQFGKYISETRRALGDNYAVSAATFSVGAYGEGIYANAQPPSAYTGMSIAGLKSNGHQLDWINIMSYDASDVFDPLQAYDAHKALYKGPLLIGAEVPPEAWGGHVISLDKVKQYVNHVKKDTSNIGGLFVWSYNKQGTPNCNDILSTAIEAFGPSLPPIIVPAPPTPSPTSPNLIGKVVLGSTIVQDNKPNWLKLDGVVIGDNFTYRSYKSTDIGGLLDQVRGDPNVAVLLYNWKTGDAYSKTGYDFTNSSDTKVNADFTSFIVKDFKKPGGTTNSNFVKWQNGQFTLSGSKFVPVGLNCYWLGYGEHYDYHTKPQIEEMFIVASKMKATTIRSHSLGFSYGSPKSLTPNTATGFNNAAWDPIDYSFSMAKKYGIKLIIPLTDPYEYYHGSYAFYTKNRGVDKTKFWSDRNVINDFKAYITAYLNHVNPYTGVAIKNAPEVAMIELGNELGNIRPTAGSNSIPTESWTREITQHIKSIDKTHLVLDGCDEALSKSGSFNVKELDVYTGHFYWLEKDRIEYGANTSANMGKPYIIGEYSSKFGSEWYSYIESRPNIKGSLAWSLYPHTGGYRSGAKVPHNDGFTLHYPEDSKELLLLTNHFRRMRGMSTVNSLEL